MIAWTQLFARPIKWALPPAKTSLPLCGDGVPQEEPLPHIRFVGRQDHKNPFWCHHHLRNPPIANHQKFLRSTSFKKACCPKALCFQTRAVVMFRLKKQSWSPYLHRKVLALCGGLSLAGRQGVLQQRTTCCPLLLVFNNVDLTRAATSASQADDERLTKWPMYSKTMRDGGSQMEYCTSMVMTMPPFGSPSRIRTPPLLSFAKFFKIVMISPAAYVLMIIAHFGEICEPTLT